MNLPTSTTTTLGGITDMVNKCPSENDDGYTCDFEEGHSGEHQTTVIVQWIEIPKLTDAEIPLGYGLWLAHKYGRGNGL
jgi:hypothetical protein